MPPTAFIWCIYEKYINIYWQNNNCLVYQTVTNVKAQEETFTFLELNEVKNAIVASVAENDLSGFLYQVDPNWRNYNPPNSVLYTNIVVGDDKLEANKKLPPILVHVVLSNSVLVTFELT